jgi:hypothetical protein
MNEMTPQYGFSDDRFGKRPTVPAKMVLAMAYVPDQTWETPYDVNEGLDRGTLFPSLDKPFLGGGNRYGY